MLQKTSDSDLPVSIAYSDGKAVEARILDLLRQSEDLSSRTSIGADFYDEVAVRYHLCADRSLLLRPFDFTGLKVLELGAGMGGISRFLAEECKHLTTVEGTEIRADALRQRLRDLDNWECHVCNIQDFESTETFDVVCLIGVLEYAELFIDDDKPFQKILEKANSLLGQDGVLIVAIENRLGLKYWNGASEDHMGKLFDGLVGYPDKKWPKTFARQELLDLINDAGLPEIREFFPFPDYKMPHTVLSDEFIDLDPSICADLAALEPFEDYGRPRAAFMPDLLAAASVAKGGLLKELANSFLYLATKKPASGVVAGLCKKMAEGEIGWHYSIGSRVVPTATTFHTPRVSKTEIEVSKAALFPLPSKGTIFVSGDVTVEWNIPLRVGLTRGPKLIQMLTQSAYHEDWQGFSGLLEDFIGWSFDYWTASTPSLLKPQALDATIANAGGKAKQGYALFDLEWTLEGEMAKTWFILRNMRALHNVQIPRGAQCPYPSFRSLYESLCERFSLTPEFDADVKKEAAFQSAVAGRLEVPRYTASIAEALLQPFPQTLASRSAANLLGEMAELETLRLARAELLNSRRYRLGGQAEAILDRLPLLRWAGRTIHRLTPGGK